MHIFLSHSDKDTALLRALKTYFPDWISYWIDDQHLFFGSHVELSLQDVINTDADYVVIFLGPEELTADWVKRELEWAFAREEELHRTFLLPVLLGDVKSSIPNLGLTSKPILQTHDYSREGIELLAKGIVNHVGQWLSERLHQETILTGVPNVAKAETPKKRTRYSDLIESLARNLTAVPDSWQDLVEAFVVKPFLRTAILSRRGEIPLNPSQYYQRILHEIGEAGEGWEVFAVSTLSFDLWASDINQRNYAKRNLQAIERNARISRLFILPEGRTGEFADTIRKQAESGVQIRMADTSLLAEAIDLEDIVIFRSPNSIRAYTCSPAIDNPRRIRSGRLIVDPDLCSERLNAFRWGWESAIDADDYLRSKSLELGVESSKAPPGLTLQVHRLDFPVVTCEEAAAAKGIKLASELKTLILETTSGLVAVHLPGDGILSLRAVKDFIEVEEAYLADPETLLKLGLSAGTVSAVLEPVWSMPHLISRRIFDRDQLSTNNRTKTGYFLFNPVILTRAENTRVGEFEARD